MSDCNCEQSLELGAQLGQATLLLEHARQKIAWLEKRVGRRHVREFHAKFQVPNPSVPTVPPEDRLRLRLGLIAEEFIELLDACAVDTSVIRHELDWYLKVMGGFIDLPKVADALADIDYVVEGMRLECGIDGEPIAEEVHRTNMAKVGGATRPDGKILKPEGWQAPDIASLLRKQGWAG